MPWPWTSAAARREYLSGIQWVKFLYPILVGLALFPANRQAPWETGAPATPGRHHGGAGQGRTRPRAAEAG
jgi:hypothetical protein